VRELVGHGIGTRFHEEPQIPNYGAPKRGPRLLEGMTLAIEPMITVGESSHQDHAGQVDGCHCGWKSLRPFRAHGSDHHERTANPDDIVGPQRVAGLPVTPPVGFSKDVPAKSVQGSLIPNDVSYSFVAR